MTVSLEHLETLVAAHPGLVLDEDLDTFQAELGDLAPFVAAHAADAHALVLAIYAYRKIGFFEEALEVGEQALALGRTFETVSAQATVYRAAGLADDALPLFEEAAALDPTDTSAMMECAKMLGAEEEFAAAESWFGRVLARDPAHGEAQMWHIYAGYAAASPEDEPAYVERMKHYCAAHPEDQRAAGFLRKMSGG